MDNETVELFKKLVYSIAKNYSHNNEELEDLYQVGNIGLLNALKNYKEGSSAKFSTYAHFYIKGEILKYIRENKGIKIGYDTQKLYNSINKVKEYLSQVNSREPSINEIAEYLEVSIQDIYAALNSNMSVKSLDSSISEEYDDLCLYDYNSYTELGYNEDILTIKDEIEKLDDFEKKLIYSRYYEYKSQSETSKILGISQVQVSRKEGKILSKIKNNIMNT